MKAVKTGIIGVGHFGRFHAAILHGLPQCEFIGVYDIDSTRSKQVADDLKVTWFKKVGHLIEQSDALFVVTPAATHFACAERVLSAGKHLFIEKPLAESAANARQLLEAANKKGVLLQVGHIERFNPAFSLLKNNLPKTINRIEANRLLPFSARGTDVSVVYDLMVHDIDLVLNLLQESPNGYDATFQKIQTPFADSCRATLSFKSGITAHLTSSRVSDKRERTLTVFSGQGKYCIDLDEQSLLLPDGRILKNSEKRNILQDEIRSFLKTVQEGHRPMVTGEEGTMALEVAESIIALESA
ncbi:MAG: hypothetical protein A2293_10210 [Elusimicrobia bacterium RIFOXYB2_FULL_49_7]|nr:MAG: hypothetical protein A2293_10210 [Elusimicrobia bacterium RIFOXYB2_FULL_49_7]